MFSGHLDFYHIVYPFFDCSLQYCYYFSTAAITNYYNTKLVKSDMSHRAKIKRLVGPYFFMWAVGRVHSLSFPASRGCPHSSAIGPPPHLQS